MSLLRPPVVLRGIANVGKRELRKTLGLVGNVVPTSVSLDADKLTCALYEPEGRKPVFGVRVNGRKTRTTLTDAAGNRIAGLKPYGIGNIVLPRNRLPPRAAS